MQTEPHAAAPLLQMTGISKSFPGVKALENVNFAVGAAEIHAFLGSLKGEIPAAYIVRPALPESGRDTPKADQG